MDSKKSHNHLPNFGSNLAGSLENFLNGLMTSLISQHLENDAFSIWTYWNTIIGSFFISLLGAHKSYLNGKNDSSYC